MTTADLLLRSVLDAPEDDAPRLVYADWLEDNGELEYSDFVRVQLRLAALPPQPKLVKAYDVDVKRGGREGLCWVERNAAIKVGDRVDLDAGYYSVEEDDDKRKREMDEGYYGGTVKRRWHGVLIIEHRPGEEFTRFVIDAESVPWPGEALRRREDRLFRANVADWAVFLPGAEQVHADHTTVAVVFNRGDLRVEQHFRRGFISEVRTTLAAWYGSECIACGGTGQRSTGQAVYPCRDCWDGRSYCGTGRVPGIGPAVAACQPVVLAYLTDRKPWPCGDQHSWWDADRKGKSGQHPESDIPRGIYELIALPTMHRSDSKSASTLAQALDALALAAAAWARGKGGQT